MVCIQQKERPGVCLKNYLEAPTTALVTRNVNGDRRGRTAARRAANKMPQGKISGLKKGGERSKPKRAAHGDQQKLRKGNFVFNTKVGKKQADDRAQKELTKKITARIESTMAARASTDGGGLQVLKAEAKLGDKPLRPGAGTLKSLHKK